MTARRIIAAVVSTAALFAVNVGVAESASAKSSSWGVAGKDSSSSWGVTAKSGGDGSSSWGVSGKSGGDGSSSWG